MGHASALSGEVVRNRAPDDGPGLPSRPQVYANDVQTLNDARELGREHMKPLNGDTAMCSDKCHCLQTLVERLGGCGIISETKAFFELRSSECFAGLLRQYLDRAVRMSAVDQAVSDECVRKRKMRSERSRKCQHSKIVAFSLRRRAQLPTETYAAALRVSGS
jgi:hypothetical protein